MSFILRFSPIQYCGSEFDVLAFAKPYAQYIFLTIQVDPNGIVLGFIYNLLFAADMVVNESQKYHVRRWTPEAAAATYLMAEILPVIQLTVMFEIDIP